jgi:hypothetical protein
MNSNVKEVQEAIAPYLADGYGIINFTYEDIPPLELIQWQDTTCSIDGNICQYYLLSFSLQLRKEVPITPDNPTGEIFFPVGVVLGTSFTFLKRIYCGDNVPTDDPAPVPPPIPLPEDTFDFCEQFPALCNACPDVGNSQDVVVSGKIASTCETKDDISFNIKF